jgi:DNA (cytosine-5)-methyltransferase 1
LEGDKVNELHLFAGAGGGILGGMLLGHTTVCAVEIEPYCQKVLLQRQRDGILPKFPIWDDVQTFDGTPWRGKVDVICGGFPCQDISAAGKGAGIEGSRSSMWKHMARIIGEVRPKYAFVENSPMLVGRGLTTVLADLAQMGYDAKWGVVGAHNVSAPHRRDRIWILAADSNVSGSGTPKRDTDGDRTETEQGWEVEPQFEPGRYGKEMANTYLPYDERARFTDRSNTQYSFANSPSAWWGQDPADSSKSRLGRMAHGVANRNNRLKAIGNGQVPQVAALAWKLLKE